jgi:hypothetical protein
VIVVFLQEATDLIRHCEERLSRRLKRQAAQMVRAVIVFFCLVASYFVTMWIVTSIWQKALVTAVLASLVFSAALLVASLVVQNRPWRAFWLANLALTAFFGGIEFYGLAIKGIDATRFGGAPLFDGHITLAGWASLSFDICLCVLSNLLGFYLAQSLTRRLNV